MTTNNQHEEQAQQVQRMLENVRNLNVTEWTQRFHEYAIHVRRKPKWQQSNERIEENVAAIFLKMIKQVTNV